MNFQRNVNLGNWLTQLNGKTIEKIYQVDFNENRHDDIYLPWLFFITFSDFDLFLEIEGDFDGDHIRINLYDNSALENKLKENHLPNEPNHWHIYDTKPDETIGLLVGQKIEFVDYGIDKDEFEINRTVIKGQKDVFTFIRFNCQKISLTIFEGSATGLGVSDDPKVKLNFEETFDNYDTREKNNSQHGFKPIKLVKTLNIEADFSLSTLLKNDHNSKNILRFEKVFSPSKQKS
jgi:aromatic ring-cleaving dioxygenase